MQIFCPKCGVGTDVASGAAAAACHACGAALPVHLPQYGPPSQHKPSAFGLDDMAAVPRVAPPRTTFAWSEAQTPDGGWVVRTGTGGAGCALGLGLVVLGTAAMAAGAWGSGKSDGEATAGVLLLVALLVAYFALCAAVNRTTLRLDGQWLTVKRGPVPLPGNVRVPAASIQYFDPVRWRTTRERGPDAGYYNVRVVAVSSMRTLPLGSFSRVQVDGVLERLKHMLEDTRRRAGITAPVLPLVGPNVGAPPGGPRNGPRN
jgi:hypothetical protein